MRSEGTHKRRHRCIDKTICISSTNKMICIRVEDQKRVLFIPEITLNSANVAFSTVIFFGSATVVPSKCQDDLIWAYNQL